MSDPKNEPLTFFDKVWDDHVVTMLGQDTALLQIDRLVLHELSGSQAVRALDEAHRTPDSRAQVFTVIEHLISTRPGRGPLDSVSVSGPAMISGTRAASKKWGFHFIDYDDPRQGIAHLVALELGIALPGSTYVCCDSHTSTVGAIGAVAWGIGASEAEHCLATQTLAQSKPQTMRVSFEGELPPGVYAKDMILALIGKIGASGGIGYAAEYAGSTVRSMAMDGRATLCNMAIEFQAKYGFVAPDEITLEYLKGRDYAPRGAQWEQASAHWLSMCTDEGARFDYEVSIDCSQLQPQVTWGTSPEQVMQIDALVPDPSLQPDAQSRLEAVRALEYMQLKPGMSLLGLPIDVAYIGSCTNARLDDLRVAARLAQGRTARVPTIVVPGSRSVKRAAEREGLHEIFMAAGFEWRDAGCSMCTGSNGDRVPSGERCASTSNRNFEGRQGRGSLTHLVSPASAVAAAITGRLSDPREFA
jgi:3-isopropylmalate/(R)-2-methylmalate dehydratase large subunit